MNSNRTASFLTLGCKVNQYESDGMAELLKNAGYDILPFGEPTDFTVINTCAVTNIASRKSRQMLNKAKKNNPSTVLVACGCYVQSVEDVLNDMPEVDIFLGNNQKQAIVGFFEEYTLNHKRQNHTIDINHTSEYENFTIAETTEHTRAYVKVQDGCNRFCSYCIIPYVRGRVRSRDMNEVIKEITMLGCRGYKEVVITGIHVTSYGTDIEDENVNFLNLLKEVNKIEGIERIRLGSLEPNIITEDFVQEIAGLSKLCPHFHLSIQSGSDGVLKRMNRHYDTAYLREAIRLLRKYYDKPALTTDIIVGFPGETEEEFAETYDFLKEANLYEMHIFQYSKRQGTVAEKMPDQVPGDIKKKRSDILLNMSKENKKAFEDGHKENVYVLIEEEVTIDGQNYLIGYTNDYVRVAIINNGNIEDYRGNIYEVNLAGRVNDNFVLGEFS